MGIRRHFKLLILLLGTLLCIWGFSFFLNGHICETKTSRAEEQERWSWRLYNPLETCIPSYDGDVNAWESQRSFQAHSKQLKSEVLKPASDQMFVIYTRYRSGSSFLGNFFSKHPDVYYLFEPLKLFSRQTNSVNYVKDYGPLLLNDMLHCRFNRTVERAKEFSSMGHSTVKKYIPRTFCAEMNKSKMAQCRKIQFLEEQCARSKYVSAKVISLFNILNLEPLVRENVKVIHLVRDPRSAFASRTKLDWIRYNKNTNNTLSLQDYYTEYLTPKRSAILISKMCADLKVDFIERPQQIKTNFRQRYKLVRYEDVASHPKGQARRLYKFLDIEMHPEVTRWITKATSANNSIKNHNPASQHLQYAYSTTRNPKDTLVQWRSELPWRLVLYIQISCKDSMRFLGYQPFSGIRQYLSRNTRSFVPSTFHNEAV